MDDTYDVVIVGGGPAGLAAGLALAQARRSVLIVDSGEPRNAVSGQLRNYLARDGASPAELLGQGRNEVTRSGGTIVSARVTEVVRQDDRFVVMLNDGRAISGRRLLLATGLTDELPDIPGVRERWGRDVLHCPYCNGWEVAEARIGVIATGPQALRQALLWRQWSTHVVYFRHRTPPVSDAESEQLSARQIAVVDGEVTGLIVDNDTLTGVHLDDGEIVEVDAVVVQPTFTANSDIAEALGLTPIEVTVDGQVIGTRIPADDDGATDVPGVWVAGNVTDVHAHVINAAANGLDVAAAINADLIAEENREAVTAYRHEWRTRFEEAAWEERYRSAPKVWSGSPNQQLVAEAADLTPGRALDVGCGEGADAIWLAERGWRVTAVDISRTALQRAQARADTAGVADRIEWIHADLRSQPPAEGAYGLVSSQYLHLPPEARRKVFASLAGAVAPGGTLLIVGHHPKDLRTTAHRFHFPQAMYTADELVTYLDRDEWNVVAAEDRTRSARDHDGREVTVRDAVLVARRHT